MGILWMIPNAADRIIADHIPVPQYSPPVPLLVLVEFPADVVPDKGTAEYTKGEEHLTKLAYKYLQMKLRSCIRRTLVKGFVSVISSHSRELPFKLLLLLLAPLPLQLLLIRQLHSPKKRPIHL
jgi:hypothetical protein